MKRKRSDSLGSSFERSHSEDSPSVPMLDNNTARQDNSKQDYSQHQPLSPVTSCSMVSSIDSAGQTIRVTCSDTRHQKESHDTHLHSSSMTSVDERSSPRPAKHDHLVCRLAKKETLSEDLKILATSDSRDGEHKNPGTTTVDQQGADASNALPQSTSISQKAEANAVDARARVTLFSSAPQRKSCDRCFRMKTKCSRAAPGASTEKPCDGCVRRGFGHDCVTSRPDFPHPKITMAKRVRREYTTPALETNTTADTAMSARIRAVQWSRQHTSQTTPPRRERVGEDEHSTSMYAPPAREPLAKTHRESLDHGHRGSSTQHQSRPSSWSRVPADYMHRDLVSEQQRMTLLPPLSSARQIHCGSSSSRHENRTDTLSGIRRSYDDLDRQQSSQYRGLTHSPPLRASHSTLGPSGRSDRTVRNVESLQRTLYESESQDEDTTRHGAVNSIRSMRTCELVSMSIVIAQELGRRSDLTDGRYISPVSGSRHR